MALSMIPPVAAPAFLAAHGWGDADILPLAGDASFRRYFRVADGDRRAVLMDAPPPQEDPRPFLAVADYLHREGFGAPRVLAADLPAGLVLLEDFGDLRMREAVDADPAIEQSVYARAVDLLAELHASPAADLAPYSLAEYQREAALLVDWYCPAAGIDPDRAGFAAAWDRVLATVLADDARRVTVLRDYHAENIMLVGDGPSLGLLDFQDALVGHPAYDLVSLLQDARRDVPEAVETAMLRRYLARAGGSPRFDASYAILGAQRNTKIIGIFTRLWQRDGKPHYLGFLPRVWRYLERDLAHPALAPVASWFDANLPAQRRGGFLKAPR